MSGGAPRQSLSAPLPFFSSVLSADEAAAFLSIAAFFFYWVFDWGLGAVLPPILPSVVESALTLFEEVRLRVAEALAKANCVALSNSTC